MLASVVFILKPEQTATLPETTGRGVHSAFLRLIERFDSKLSHHLHADARFKPFTVSPLVGEFRHWERTLVATSDREYWARFSAFDSHLMGRLSELMLGVAPESVGRLKLFDSFFEVIRVCKQEREHTWARTETFEDLYRGVVDSKWLSRKPGLRFVTPTSFRVEKRSFLVPLPSRVFMSLGEKWRLFAPAELARPVTRFLEELPLIVNHAPGTNGEGRWSLLDDLLTLSRYDLKTSAMVYKDHEEIGFTGEAQFEMLGGARSQALTVIHSLARFAFYAGVGYKTTMGMGQVTPL
jgi:CRISPR-associated endoribonuclease Cas6